MTTLQNLDRRTVAALERGLSAFLHETISDHSDRIVRARTQITQINHLKKRDGVKERNDALAKTLQQLESSQHHYAQQKKKAYRLGGLLAPFSEAKSQLTKADEKHLEAIRAYDEPSAKTLRDSQIAAHNQHVTDKRQEQAELNVELHKLTQDHQDLSEFAQEATEALIAACGQGWLALDFGLHLAGMDASIRQGNVALARRHLARLVFQKRPDDPVYDRLKEQALELRKRAYSAHHGVPVTGSFADIVEASAQLAAANMKADCASQLLDGLHSSDQWQVLTTLVASPQNLRIDVLWSIYWGMFRCQQKMADVLNHTVSTEDPLNGRFSQCVEDGLSEWAAKRIPLFGYPESQSYLGMLQLANTDEETRVGADIGVIIALNIGGLVCRKAVLLQAKRAKDWEADVGSKKGQLPKLSKLPRGGYYLFYHESPQLRLDSPVPTVSSAQALQQLILDANKNPNATKLKLDVRSTGWDWASFISFGLCDASSDIGEPFDTVDDAMRILGSGDTGALPLHLLLLAIEDEPFTLELTKRLHNQYRRAEPQQDRSMSKTSKKDHGREGADLEL
ncbi:hypothetical protein [Pseudomonas azotoformans]|uniref:hypothetical protein n=1 Tax=Pseudomonas azotoformans TaxID=47878 RepID=UPI00122E8269|nr:hypothetical protein [Pseudomonas azotoformans]UMY52111.1 hypothetical protein MLC69_13945 [Pseudomonas azotoformans]